MATRDNHRLNHPKLNEAGDAARLLKTRLGKSPDLSHLFFEGASLGLNLCRMDGTWIESNPAFYKMIGYTREEADSGLTYWQLTPRKYDDMEKRQLESLARDGRYGPYEKEFIRKDGSLVPVRLNGFIVERNGEKLIWSVIEDLSKIQTLDNEVKELERAMRMERAKAIQNAKLASLGELAAGIAHEINNPLAIIYGSTELLMNYVNDPVKLGAKVDSIKRSCERIAKIVAGLKKFSRSGEKSVLTVHSLEKVVSESLVLTESKAKRANTVLTFECGSDAEVECDEIEIEQVLVNLINNAIDATEEVTNRWVRISIFEEGPFVVLQVRDSGMGIPENIRDRLFEPFVTGKRSGKGTGLGLSIAKGILDEHGATITLLSDEPETCFEVRFKKVEGKSHAP